MIGCVCAMSIQSYQSRIAKIWLGRVDQKNLPKDAFLGSSFESAKIRIHYYYNTKWSTKFPIKMDFKFEGFSLSFFGDLVI